jgi:hypothetical protein
MNIREALQLVHDLAYQNRLEDTDGEEQLETEQERQDVALDLVCDLLTSDIQQDNDGQWIIYTGISTGTQPS